MIKATLRKQVTEKEYRALSIDSSSTLKDFYDSPIKYFQKHILGEEQEDEAASALIGSIVHTFLLELPEKIDEKYYLSTCESTPTEKMLDFCNALFRHTVINCTEDGEITTSFQELCELAHQESGFKWKLDRVLNDFTGKLPEQYYRELREAWGQKKKIVTVKDLSLAEKIAECARQDEVSGPLVNLESNNNVQVYSELQVDGFEIDGLSLKAMIDKIIVDHEMHTVQGNDLKIVWSPSKFYNEYYLARKSFIQAYVYTKAIEHIMPDIAGDNYVQLPFQFIAIDSTMKERSLVYRTCSQDLEEAYNGFYERGWYYRGVKEIVSDLLWHKDCGVWNTSRMAYMNNGILPLRKIA
jgi:hypothetical protein